MSFNNKYKYLNDLNEQTGYRFKHQLLLYLSSLQITYNMNIINSEIRIFITRIVLEPF